MLRVSSLLRLASAAVVLLVLVVTTLATAPSAAAAACQSGFTVFTDPANPGDSTTHGQTTIVRDSGVLGSYQDGRLAGYAISGQQDIIINSVTQKAELPGMLTATSPDGGSSLTLRYAGHADLATGQAQKIDVAGDRVTFVFSPTHRALREQFEQSRSWVETTAERVVGRRVMVESAQGVAPAPGGAGAPKNESAGASGKRDLKEDARSSATIQAMLEVFPAEIRDVEEMEP